MKCNCCLNKLVSTDITVCDDKLIISIEHTHLKPLTKYCLVVIQPIPISGVNLPVIISNGEDLINVDKFGFGNLLYGKGIEYRKRIPLYYTDGGKFTDIRRYEHLCYCREV